MHTRSIVLAGLLSVVLASCYASETHDAAATASETPRVTAKSESVFEADLLRIAKNYRSWTRVSDRANWAPTDCRAPTPDGVQVSASEDGSTHGRKLYYLFARNAESYRRLVANQPCNLLEAADWERSDSGPQLDAYERNGVPELAPRKSLDIGQALVKEAWQPIEVKLDEVPRLDKQSDGRTRPSNYAVDGKHAYRTGEQAELFIMFKLDSARPDTDQGWVYGTVTADGKAVTSAGRVESCMNCHDDQFTRDRLFGLR